MDNLSSDVVAELYAYSDEEMDYIIAREIHKDRMRRKRIKEQKRKAKKEELKTWLTFFLLTFGFTIFMICHWIISGYGC